MVVLSVFVFRIEELQ